MAITRYLVIPSGVMLPTFAVIGMKTTKVLVAKLIGGTMRRCQLKEGVQAYKRSTRDAVIVNIRSVQLTGVGWMTVLPPKEVHMTVPGTKTMSHLVVPHLIITQEPVAMVPLV